MKVISAEFVTSAAGGGTSAGIPRDGLPQVAMIGRSNVGKSALINALCRRPIARTSAAPGKTRHANVYRLTVEGGGPGRWDLYFIDLPGYGYARGGSDAAKELALVAESYFAASKGTRVPDPARGANAGSGTFDVGSVPLVAALVTLLLVDSRHPGLESDIQAHRWLRSLGVEPLIVATKVDKLTRAERVKNLRELERVFGTAPLPVSAQRGEGLDELWTSLARTSRGTKDRR